MMVEGKSAFASGLPDAVLRKRDYFFISAYWFASNLLWGSLLVIIIPSQMREFAPTDPGRPLGLLLGLGAIPALVVPLLAGPLSDRCCSRLGRRRPYMIAGSAINMLGLALLWLGASRMNLAAFFAGYIVTNIGNNTATGAYSGMIPDMVPESRRGEASGWMATMSQAGTVLGIVSAALLRDSGLVTASYVVIMLSLLAFLLITVIGVRERPRAGDPEPIRLAEFVKDLWIDPRKHPDFAWVWITRALVVMGLWMVQEWMMYYLVDVIGVPEARREIWTGAVLVTLLVFATITGIVGGRISDRVGRKRVVYIANTVIALGCIAFVLSPSLPYIFVVSAIFGLAFGAYLSVDWALGCDVLPNKEEAAAKDMAVWHIAMVLPQTIIMPVSGLLLSRFRGPITYTPDGPLSHYTSTGYTLIFLIAAGLMLLGAILLRNVRGVR